MWLLMWVEDIGGVYEVKSEYGKEVGKDDHKKDVGMTDDEDTSPLEEQKTEQLLDVSAETPNRMGEQVPEVSAASQDRMD